MALKRVLVSAFILLGAVDSFPTHKQRDKSDLWLNLFRYGDDLVDNTKSGVNPHIESDNCVGWPYNPSLTGIKIQQLKDTDEKRGGECRIEVWENRHCTMAGPTGPNYQVFPADIRDGEIPFTDHPSFKYRSAKLICTRPQVFAF